MKELKGIVSRGDKRGGGLFFRMGPKIETFEVGSLLNSQHFLPPFSLIDMNSE